MASGGEDDLVCDFAEYYHVWNWRELPVDYAAVLANGLPEESRSWRRINGQAFPTEILLQALLIDKVSNLVWMFSEDGQNGDNPPVSILEILSGRTEPTKKARTFQNGEEFMETYRKMLGEA